MVEELSKNKLPKEWKYRQEFKKLMKEMDDDLIKTITNEYQLKAYIQRHRYSLFKLIAKGVIIIIASIVSPSAFISLIKSMMGV